MNRRMLLKLSLSTLAIFANYSVAKDQASGFPFQLSKDEWKEKLTPFEFAVLREEAALSLLP